MRILESGSCEVFKGVIHGVTLSLVAVMGLYNLAAWVQRRQGHLAFNAVVYLGGIVFELEHVNHHRVAAIAAQAAALAAAAEAASEVGEAFADAPARTDKAA